MEAQFQLSNDLLESAFTEVVKEAMRVHSFSPASEFKLTNPKDVQKAIGALKVGKAPGPKGKQNTALINYALSFVFFLIVLFNAIFDPNIDREFGKTLARFRS